MGFFSGLLGHASVIDVDEVEAEFNRFLVEGEYIQQAFKVIRDILVFTNRRMILTDKQGLSGKKFELHSIPFKSITQFATETAGRFDADAELKIWVAGQPEPYVFEFKRGTGLLDVQLLLAEYVM